MISKYIVPTIAVISGAYAQCSASASSGTTTLSATSDASAIINCATYTGSIAIATGLMGDVVLDGIQQITGSLSGPSVVNLTSLSASTLYTIAGNLTLGSARSLNALNMPVLGSVGGLSLMTTGTQYEQLGFGNLSSIGSLTIIDTFLQNLDGMNINTADSINIAQNKYLNTIDMSTLTSLDGTLSITANADGATNASFNKLTTASGVTIQNATALALPALSTVSGGVYLTFNNFDSVSLPALTTTNDFTINNNSDLTSLSAPNLTTVNGAVNVLTNPMLSGNLSFPSLSSVTGSMDMIGEFSGVSTPKLNTVLGVVVINSTADLGSTCSTFQGYEGNVVHGTVTCNGGSDSTSSGGSGGSSASGTSTGGSGTSTSTSSSSGSTSSSASASGYESAHASTYTVFGLLAALFALFL